ncbi:MAG: hypothetical protein J3R72DRAFT_489879 [Linnemannia gamsii]|nr:MAG: hypothetical protein J3R72DRAFT_489879 [Linnemannia gamsii]
MDTSNTQANKTSQLPMQQGSEALLGPTRRDARSVLHHPYEALNKAHHQQHQHYYRHHHYLRHERYSASNSSEVWTLPPSPHSSASTSASSLARTAEWLRWLIQSAAVSSLEGIPNDSSTRQLMLLDLSADGSSSTGSHSRAEFDRMPGFRYYNQGTEETTGRPMSSTTPTTTTSRTAQNTTAKSHHNANAISNNNSNNNNNISSSSSSNSNPKANANANTRSGTSSSQSTTTPHHPSGSSPYPLTPSSWSSQPPTPPTPPSSFSRSTVNSATIAAAARNARNRGENDDKSASSSSPSSGRPNRGSSSAGPPATVGAGTPTSALLFSTSQEFHQVWSQTTAFLHRTFSPTYRVGHLYWDSWTNGTQRRGLERLKTSVLRGDAFRLMQNTTVQLRKLWDMSVAESKVHASEIERQAKAIEDKRRQIQERAFGKPSSSSASPTSSSSKPSSETGRTESSPNTNSSSSNNKAEEGGQGKPRDH